MWSNKDPRATHSNQLICVWINGVTSDAEVSNKSIWFRNIFNTKQIEDEWPYNWWWCLPPVRE